MSKTMVDCSNALWRSQQGILPIPWREDIQLPKKLRIGYFKTDDFLPASPACQRAVDMSVEALRQAGHECVEVSIPNMKKAMMLFVAMTSADGYESLLSHLDGDPSEP